MKTRRSVARWLGAVVACSMIGAAVSAPAKKPPKPPPEPSGPAYQIITIDVEDVFPTAISDSGMLAGLMVYDWNPGEFGNWPLGFSLPPRIVAGEVKYLAEDLQRLEFQDGDDTWSEAEALDVNEAGITVGHAWTGYSMPYHAALWLADGTPIDLGAAPADADSRATAVNALGLVTVGQAGISTAGVVVPLDANLDGEPDDWFADLDYNGINDLLYPIESEANLTPVAINEAGQIALEEGYLLTPDFGDADGDGNPWYANVDGDEVNDLLVALAAPIPGEAVLVDDLNDLGQVVGHSGSHVVRWDFVGGVQTVTDLGSLSPALVMLPQAMNDSGQIVGTSTKRGHSGPGWLIENGTMYELSLSPKDINNAGWICGNGFVAIPLP